MIIYDQYCVTIAFSNVVGVTLLLRLDEAIGEGMSLRERREIARDFIL